MSIPLIYEHLALLDDPQLSSRQVTNILFNLGNISRHFKKLLATANSMRDRKAFESNLGKIRVVNIESSERLSGKAKKVILGNPVVMSHEEVFIIKTVFLNERITQNIRTNLRLQLGYSAESLVLDEFEQCPICSRITKQGVCSTCKERLRAFTEYRRESFEIPINFLNFSLPSGLPLSSQPVNYSYQDWDFFMDPDMLKIYAVLVDREVGMVQYPLPIVDYQRLITA